MLLSLLCLSTLALGLALSLAGSTREEREQAALLPFADDPEAARRVARDTGKICRQVVRPPRGAPRSRRPAVPRLNRLHHPGMDASSTKVPCGAGNGPFLLLRRVP